MNDDDFRTMIQRLYEGDGVAEALAKFIYEDQCSYVGAGHEEWCIQRLTIAFEEIIF